MSKLNVKGVIFLIFVLFFQFLGLVAEGNESSILTTEFKHGNLVVRSTVMNFDDIVSITLNNEIINFKENVMEGLSDVYAHGQSFELSFPLPKKFLNNTNGYLLSIFLLNGTSISVPVVKDCKHNVSSIDAVQATMPDGIYKVNDGLLPNSNMCVKQNLVTNTYSYKNEKGAIYHWYFCGQAAMATTINCLRQKYVTDTTKIAQLQWFHERLKIRQPNYISNTINPHKEANIDALYYVMLYDKKDEFNVQILKSGDRSLARDSMLTTLKSGNKYLVALSQIVINGVTYTHYYAVYKIYYQKTKETGGTVYYCDPYTGYLGTMAFSDFLTKMDLAGTLRRFSFIAVSKKL